MPTIHIGAIRFRADMDSEWQYGLAQFKQGPGCADIDHVIKADGEIHRGPIWDYQMLTYQPVSVASGCATFEFPRI